MLLSGEKFEPQHEISNNVVCVASKGSDQPAHTRSLIRAFASRLNILNVKLLTDSKLNRRLHRLVWVYTCQNTTLLEITYCGSLVNFACSLSSADFFKDYFFQEKIQNLYQNYGAQYFWSESKLFNTLMVFPIWPNVIKLFSCSTQLSTKFQLLIKTNILTNKEVSCFQSLRCCTLKDFKNAKIEKYYFLNPEHFSSSLTS